MTDSSLTYHEFNDCLWIRCASRGSFVAMVTRPITAAILLVAIGLLAATIIREIQLARKK